MKQAENGDTVKIHYTGKLENGDLFDSSKDRDPLEFVIGGGNVIPGFEKGITGMEPGESKRLTIEPEEAYGKRHEELVGQVKKNEFPDDITPVVGMQLQMMQQNGTPVNVVVTVIDEENITLDANHPLAGQTLIFDVQLIEIC